MRGFPVVLLPRLTRVASEPPLAVLPIEPPEETERREIIGRWLAIIITSLAFAAVHGELAFVPPLFLLSLGLGYLYERTGNLWAPIAMHALFNGTQIVVFLVTGAE